MFLFNLALFTVACIVLVKCNNVLISALSKIAYFFRLTEFTVGFIIVSLATSIPDLFVGIMSALYGIPELSVGNVIGSAIVKLTLIAGITIILAKSIRLDSSIIKKDILYMLVISIIPVILILDQKIFKKIGLFTGSVEGLSRFDGVILLLVFFIYVFKIISQESKSTGHISIHSRKEGIKQVFLFLASAVVLLLSANFVVEFAKLLAIDMNLSTLLFGLFIVSLGTSLPELSFGAKAALSGHKGMAIGNIVGSVIANFTLTLGITAIISPITINSLVYFTGTLFMIFSAFIFFTFASSGNKLTWREGMTLIMLYVLFIVIQNFIRV